MKPAPRPFAALAAAVLLAGAALAEGDAATGRQLYATRCAACHSIDYNGVGPRHGDLFGRRAGSVPGFAYSDALRKSGVVWDEQSLARWLTDPEKFIPGQKMFIQIPDAKDRADLIAFLKTQSRTTTGATK